MIKRDKYLNLLIKNRDNGFPKVITGIRRCGKSYLLKEIYKAYLLENGVDEKNILILELDDDRNALYRDPLALGLSREKNIDLYVTGSNSKMLSSDIITEFRDILQGYNRAQQADSGKIPGLFY